MPVASGQWGGLVAAVVVVLAGAPGLAFAGSDNVLYLEQDGVNNNFLSDQSQASDSSIFGFSAFRPSASAPAQQTGPDNNADLSIVGEGGSIALKQDNSLSIATPVGTFGLPLAGNSATASVAGGGSASILQLGGGNQATVDVSDGSSGTIDQLGLNNSASLTLSGGLDGTINQAGLKNVAALVASGPSGTSVTLNQIGIGANYSYATPGPAVVNAPPIYSFSNKSLTITQYHF